jgi:ring-1,2-phenylacetyl-CoA epoxidase subunit PaaC
MQRAADDLWMYTGELFEMDDVDRAMLECGVGVDLERLHPLWMEHVRKTFAEATLTVPPGKWMQRGGKRGIHTERLGYLLADMQFLQRAYPGTQW